MEIDYTVKPSQSQRLKQMLQNWRLLAFVGFFFVVFGSLGYTIFSEVISGGVHKRGDVVEVNLKAMGNFPFEAQGGTVKDVPPKYRALDGKKVLLQGFMYTPNSAGSDASSCQLVYNVQKCCFSGPPQVQERVFLHPPADRKVSRYDQYTLVNVIGTLSVKVERDSVGNTTSVYTMVPDDVTPAS